MSMTRAEQKQVSALRRLMPRLKKADIVTAHLPDGQEVLVKGKDALDAVIATGKARRMMRMHVDLLHLESAAALETVLGGDGFYSKPNHVGHA